MIAEFKPALESLPPRARMYLTTYARHPTEKNKGFMVGYATAMADGGLIRQEAYSDLLSIIGQAFCSDEVCRTLLEEWG